MNSKKPLIACIVGTRPEAIKVAPLVQELRKWSSSAETLLISTGQHREMLEQALSAFDLKPDADLKIMTQGQSLARITSRALEGLDAWIEANSPDFILAQGDTTTTFAASLAAFYRGVPFGHVESGLRTESVLTPFPEEFNRRAAAIVSTLHFAPTRWAMENLLSERVPAEAVFLTGNTGVDAVLQIAAKPGKEWATAHSGRVVVMTTHRRENWGEPMRAIAEATLEIANRFVDVLVIAPQHRNPVVREVLSSVLTGHPRIQLIEPPDYADFVALLKRSDLVLSDSGGVQEEAPTFGVPTLVLRESTERPEGVEAGVAKLVGTDKNVIVSAATELLSDPEAYAKMARGASPYGDGNASGRIRKIVLDRLGIESPEVAPLP